jgi:hypothetical protein
MYLYAEPPPKKSKYIVFRCKKCGKFNYQTISKLNVARTDLILRCHYQSCKHTSSIRKTQVFKIFENPYDAKNLMNALNLGHIKCIALDVRESLAKLGRDFINIEAALYHKNNDFSSSQAKKYYKNRPKVKVPKVTHTSVILRYANKLGLFSEEDLRKIVVRNYEPKITFDRFTFLFDKLRQQGYILQVDRDLYKYNPDV